MRWDFAVVGGGIVGAATARALTQARPGSSVVLIEKESALGRHQSGHNSGVIHAGIYYEPGSLKAELCRAGRVATEEYADQHGLPWRRTGKLLVATDQAQLGRLAQLEERARINQISHQRLSAGELVEREPHVRGLGALLIHDTGIADYPAIVRSLGAELERAGGQVLLDRTLTGVREDAAEMVLDTSAGEIRAERVVFCAGLQADRVARLAGIDTGIAIVPFRGEYYDVAPAKRRLVDTLIYPVPDPALPFLGVHLTLAIDGGLNVGPNAVLGLAREGYAKGSLNLADVGEMARFPGMWRLARGHVRTGLRELHHSWSKRAYLRLCQAYCPDLELVDLLPREAGIRAQAVRRDGSFVHDFWLRRTPRSLHVLNAPSPAATSALPIAERILAGLFD